MINHEFTRIITNMKPRPYGWLSICWTRLETKFELRTTKKLQQSTSEKVNHCEGLVGRNPLFVTIRKVLN